MLATGALTACGGTATSDVADLEGGHARDAAPALEGAAIDAIQGGRSGSAGVTGDASSDATGAGGATPIDAAPDVPPDAPTDVPIDTSPPDAAPDVPPPDEDVTPPTFDGVLGCEADTITARLWWNPGSDDVTAPSALAYDVYVARAGASYDFSSPHQSSAPGATELHVQGLASRAPYRFVVRARDAAGNRDAGLVEVQCTTLTSFSLDVEPLFAQACLGVGCHEPGNPPFGLILAPGFAYDQIVNVPAILGPYLRVDSSTSDPAQSKVWRLMEDLGPGFRMPIQGLRPVEERDLVASWIRQGARRN